MSDKLQEIKLLAHNAMATGKGHVDLTTYALTWLIEQLEQAQTTIEEQKSNYSDLEDELERINNHLFDSCKQFEQAQAANQKLVECLEWYADKENRDKKCVVNGITIDLDSAVMVDNGDLAEQTLSEVKGNG